MSVLGKYRVKHQGNTCEILFHSFSCELYFWIMALTFKFPICSSFFKNPFLAEQAGRVRTGEEVSLGSCCERSLDFHSMVHAAM